MPSLKLLLLAILGTGLIFSVSTKAEAAEKLIGPVKALEAELRLQADGQLRVKQRLTLNSPEPLVWTVFSRVRDLKVSQGAKPEIVTNVSLKNSVKGTTVTSSTPADVWVLEYLAPAGLIRHNDRDQLYFKLLDAPGLSVESVVVDLFFPAAMPAELGANAYAINGVAPVTQSLVQPDQLRFESAFAGTQSIFTVNSSWPKSVLNLSWIQELRLTVINLELTAWLIGGLSLPILSLAVLAQLIYRTRKEERLSHLQPTSQPPSNLSPLIAGVLVNKKVRAQEVASLLIDFCQRGYAVIVKKSGGYFLGRRRRSDDKLESWERNILDELFPSLELTLGDENLRFIGRQSLWRPQIRQAFSQIYQSITNKHFFVENPHFTRVRYKLIALIFYYLAGLGLVWVAASGSSSYLLIPLAGSLAISWLIIRLTPNLVRYTPEGKAARGRWLAFAAYLGLKEPIVPEEARRQTFEKYLAYAVAFGKTSAWADRFDRSSSAIVRPDWFITYQETSAGQFVDELLEFTERLSKILTSLRGPLVN